MSKLTEDQLDNLYNGICIECENEDYNVIDHEYGYYLKCPNCGHVICENSFNDDPEAENTFREFLAIYFEMQLPEHIRYY